MGGTLEFHVALGAVQSVWVTDRDGEVTTRPRAPTDDRTSRVNGRMLDERVLHQEMGYGEERVMSFLGQESKGCRIDSGLGL